MGCINPNDVYLIDYELLGQSTNGLAVIEELGRKENIVLVTSRYEEPAIKTKCEALGIKLLPKALAGFVPMEIGVPKERYDWVLIDDDDITLMSWEIAAKNHHKKFVGFKSPEDFALQHLMLDQRSAIFIDSNLGNGIKGEDIAKQLYSQGFKELYLATGYDPETFPKMNFIKAVIGKSPPSEI